MGPAIIFDKSALQSLSRPAVTVASSLFYSVLPDVLLHEILADLSLERKNVEPQERVAMLAKKIPFQGACTSMYFGTLCVQDLLGASIPMERRPVVAESSGRRIVSEDGQVGFVRDVQPENEAVLRWGGGVFSKEDFEFAAKWRNELPDLNTDASAELRRMKLGVSSMEDAAERAGAMLSDPSNHLSLLSAYMDFLGCGELTKNRVLFRWQIALPSQQRLWVFAPYTAYCLRIHQLYYVAASYGLLPTKANTLKDLEYFYHAPFAHVFCSSDRLHKRMAPFILGSDQSFVDGDKMKAELDALAELRKSDPDAMPQEGSLIYGLWIKHWKRAPAPTPPISEEERERMGRELKPIMEAIQRQAKSQIPSERFPKSP